MREQDLAEMLEFRTIELQKIKVVSRMRISNYVLAHQEWRSILEDTHDRMVFEHPA